MRVGAIQSCYLPWRGYFDFIASVDIFVLYDDVQYASGSYRNRNQIKMPGGLKWITVPVAYSFGDPIDAVRIAESQKSWKQTHKGLLTQSLGNCPYFDEALELWELGLKQDEKYLSQLNVRLLRLVCDYLKISTPLVNARDYQLNGSKTERLLMLLRKLSASCYLSGPSAKEYLDEDAFRHAGIALEYKSYDYKPYEQPWGAFVGAVTILDLIANCGPQSIGLVRSLSPNTVAVPMPA